MGQNLSVKIKNFLQSKRVVGILIFLVILFLLLGRKKTLKTFATQKVEKGKIEVMVSASGTVRSEYE